MDINLSNESLVFISVTFATMVSYFIYCGRSMQLLRNLRVKQGETYLMIFMCFFHLQCKSAAPIFLLLFAFAFRCFIHHNCLFIYPDLYFTILSMVDYSSS